ncbi:MAG TPA: rod shape-determining protein MreC [Clostridiales bacterium]|nr:rod shape-determining protein MreC [Clostridiales bacterium]
MNVLRNRPLIVTVVVLVLLVLLVAATASSNAISGRATAVGDAFAPLQAFFYQLSASISDTFSNENADYQAENEQLAAELSEYKSRLSKYDEIVAENERLSGLLEYKQNNEGQELKVARITGKDPSNWFDAFTIDLGARDGVTENMPVITADGLVGRVEEVGLSWSKVIGIIDSRSKVSAIMERTRDVGIAEGQLGKDDLSTTLAMNFLPLDADVVEGDVVITSGLDDIFPKGFVIGSVASTESGSGGMQVRIKPAVDFRRLEEVMVVFRVVDTTTVVEDNIADESAVAAPTESPAGESEPPAGGEE